MIFEKSIYKANLYSACKIKLTNICMCVEMLHAKNNGVLCKIIKLSKSRYFTSLAIRKMNLFCLRKIE